MTMLRGSLLLSSRVKPRNKQKTILQGRFKSSIVSTLRSNDKLKPYNTRSSSATVDKLSDDGLWRLKTSALLRNIVLGKVFSSPFLVRTGLKILKTMASSSSAILHADRNPILRSILRPLLYDQFCAGATKQEIAKTRELVLSSGYAGIILAYGKEMPVDKQHNAQSSNVDEDHAALQHWRYGNLETLDMMGPQDFLAIKYTGAGSRITNILRQDGVEPPDLMTAVDDICSKASLKGCRLWIDSESSDIQRTIDTWTINLMRRHNRSRVLVYNTLQAYLKDSRQKLQQQIRLASREGWHLGTKLVRGAYIELDQRRLIHDTKNETDQSYNSIVQDLLSCSVANLGLSREDRLPNMQLFLAGHNPESISMAWELTHQLEQAGRLNIVPDFGQLQGMGDQVSCQLLQRAENLANAQQRTGGQCSVPKIYKYSPWGTLQECMAYLLRRAQENSGGTERLKDGITAYQNELGRRLRRRLYLGRDRDL